MLALFDQSLITLVCFFFFLFFAISAASSKAYSAFQELSIDARAKLSSHLAVRETLIQEPELHLEGSIRKIRALAASYGPAALDIILWSAPCIKKSNYNACSA